MSPPSPPAPDAPGSPSPPTEADGLFPGATLGRYDLVREIGRGRTGVVWEARDRELGRRVAVKVLRGPGGSIPERRLVAEAEVAARLSHPGLVTVLDVGRGDRGAWLVQEFLVGRTLSSRLREGALPLQEAMRIAVRLSSALAYAHRHGVIHRGLTATDVFLCEDGQVKILDLGMGQAVGGGRLADGTGESTAPEQALGEPEDERVDVYALGVLLHRMVTGETPFPADAPPGRRVAPRLEVKALPSLGGLVERMLAAEPGARPRDAGEVLGELEPLEAALPRTRTTTRPGEVRVRRRWPRGLRVLAGAGIAAGLVAAGALGSRIGAGPVAPPGSRGAGFAADPIAVGTTLASPACTWGRGRWTELDREPAGARKRNGELGGQGVDEVSGRKAWKITSDWGQLVLPGDALRGSDLFAVEAEFFMPPMTGWMRGADITVFTDPQGGPATGEMAPGIRLAVGESPEKAPWFEWHEPDGKGGARKPYVGNLPGPVAGRWHTLRIEGSRSARWYRGLLDGRPLVVAFGEYDLSGTHVILGAGYGYMHPVDVAWSNLRVFPDGSQECR